MKFIVMVIEETSAVVAEMVIMVMVLKSFKIMAGMVTDDRSTLELIMIRTVDAKMDTVRKWCK